MRTAIREGRKSCCCTNNRTLELLDLLNLLLDSILLGLEEREGDEEVNGIQ